MERVRDGVGHGLVAVVGGRGVAADQAPAVRAARVDVSDVQRPVRPRIVADEEDFAEVMDGQYRALPVSDRLGLDAQPSAGKDAAPAFADRGDADQADPGRVDAQGFLVFGPQLHEEVGIALEDGLVEGLLEIFGGGEIGGFAHDLRFVVTVTCAYITDSFKDVLPPAVFDPILPSVSSRIERQITNYSCH